MCVVGGFWIAHIERPQLVACTAMAIAMSIAALAVISIPDSHCLVRCSCHVHLASAKPASPIRTPAFIYCPTSLPLQIRTSLITAIGISKLTDAMHCNCHQLPLPTRTNMTGRRHNLCPCPVLCPVPLSPQSFALSHFEPCRASISRPPTPSSRRPGLDMGNICHAMFQIRSLVFVVVVAIHLCLLLLSSAPGSSTRWAWLAHGGTRSVICGPTGPRSWPRCSLS